MATVPAPQNGPKATPSAARYSAITTRYGLGKIPVERVGTRLEIVAPVKLRIERWRRGHWRR
jgi:hypothetical protein